MSNLTFKTDRRFISHQLLKLTSINSVSLPVTYALRLIQYMRDKSFPKHVTHVARVFFYASNLQGHMKKGIHMKKGHHHDFVVFDLDCILF